MAVLNNRLKNFLESNRILADEQNCYWKNRSCEDHIFFPVKHCEKAQSSSDETFIDFCEAFDLLTFYSICKDWCGWEALLFSLIELCINGYQPVCKLIWSPRVVTGSILLQECYKEIVFHQCSFPCLSMIYLVNCSAYCSVHPFSSSRGSGWTPQS